MLTGFAPFGNDAINPSWEVVKRLQGKNIHGTRIIGMKLPVVFGKAGLMVINAINKYQPDMVLSLGQNANAAAICVERVGLNIHTGQDENKKTPENELIIADGPPAYFSQLPIKNILAEVKKNNMPMNISYNAGTYLCNEVLYMTLHHISKHKLPTKAGFIHLPLLVEQAAHKNISCPSMSLEIMVSGTKLILGCLIRNIRNGR